MRAAAWASAFSAIAFISFANAAPVSLQPATFVTLQASVVRVEANRERGALSVGTGVTIAPAIDGGRIIESDTAFTSGASGGGLFDSAGSLVGLLTFRSRGETRTFYALPVGWVRDGLLTAGQWDAVHPLSDGMPFWQRDLATLPYFMRAPPLYAEGRWSELIESTERWSASDPRDAEPLRVRGDAQRKMDRNASAVVSYSEAMHIAPDDARAWYGLALAYAGLGDAAALKRTESMLAGFDPALATRLHGELEGLHRPINGSGSP